jgi:hypothetical protein
MVMRHLQDRLAIIRTGLAFLTGAASFILASSSSAAPTKVVCLGEQTTITCEGKLAIMWPALLQTALGASYNVVNEGGDTQGTVLTGTSYCKVGIGGADWYWNLSSSLRRARDELSRATA